MRSLYLALVIQFFFFFYQNIGNPIQSWWMEVGQDQILKLNQRFAFTKIHQFTARIIQFHNALHSLLFPLSLQAMYLTSLWFIWSVSGNKDHSASHQYIPDFDSIVLTKTLFLNPDPLQFYSLHFLQLLLSSWISKQ